MDEPDHEKLRRELESAASAARATPPRRPVLGRNVLVGLLVAVPVAAAALLAVNAAKDDPTPDPAGNTGAAPDEPGLPPQPPRSSTARPPATSTGPDVPPDPEPAPATPAPTPGQGSAAAPGRATAHTVATGETLARIAVRYGVPLEQIAERNGVTDPDVIQVGQHLDIPDAGPDQLVIEPGATLSGYAEQYGTTVEALVALNPQITDPDDIISGGRLRLR